MSHFVTMVIVPKEEKGNEVSVIAELFDKYNEGKEMPEYIVKCYCQGKKALHDAENKYDINKYRKKFHDKDFFKESKLNVKLIIQLRDETLTVKKKESLTKKFSENEKIIDDAWAKVIAQRQKLVDAFEKKHKLYNKVDKKCSECKGTGKRPTTYNPNSKWDWYVIGGRWSNWIPNNMIEAGKYATMCEQNPDNFPFAFVTRDGQWIEKGEMLYFGMSRNEKDEKAWHKEVIDMMKKNPDDIVVVVDCHI